MRKVMFFLLLLVVDFAAYSVPAYRSRWNAVLVDGTRVSVTVMGDEHYSWLLDDDGFVLTPSGDGRTYVRTAQRLDDAVATSEVRRNANRRRIGSAETAPLPTTGSPKVPVILVEFQDSVFTVADTPAAIREHYNRFCNGSPDGIREPFAGNYGSIRDYFREQSGGLFTPEFVIIGPVKLHQKESYYAQNDAQGNRDILYSQFRSEALQLARQAYTGDWSAFDNKKKGQVDLAFFIFAGPGENTASKNDYLMWPKESTGSVKIDDVTIATTGCTSEMRAQLNKDGDVIGTTPDGIGVFCHELSHALGLPDFYDVNYNAFGMDIWSIMDFGCYAGNGRCPGGYNSYELDFMGWRELPTITDNGTYTLLPLHSGGQGVKVVNPENPNEYYILENRQRKGWDQAICTYSSGMLVIHVDYDRDSWVGNKVNIKADHQRMSIIAANNIYIGTTSSSDFSTITKTWAGNLYPFEGNDSLTAHSTPAATVFSASGYMGQDINHIRVNSDSTVTFHFGNDYEVGIAAPMSAPARQQHEWYDLSGRKVGAGAWPPSRTGIYVRGGRKYARFQTHF